MTTPQTLAVAFFRNVNLGHRGSPVRAQLEDAFRAAGATDVASFQTNGTVIHRSDDPTVSEQVIESLVRQGCAPTVAFTMAADTLLSVLDGLPPAEVHAGAYREALTLLDPTFDVGPLPEPTPLLMFLAAGPGWVHSVIWKVDGVASSPSAVLEKQHRVPTTTRTRGTVERLAVRLRPLMADGATG